MSDEYIDGWEPLVAANVNNQRLLKVCNGMVGYWINIKRTKTYAEKEVTEKDAENYLRYWMAVSKTIADDVNTITKKLSKRVAFSQ